MVAAARQAFSGISAAPQEEPRGLKRAAADDDCLKDAGVPDAKRLRLAQWLRETPRAVKNVLGRAKGQLASSAIALSERPLLERPLLPREGLRRVAAAARGGADSARAAASSVGSTLVGLRGGLRAAAASAREAAKLGAGLRGWAAKAASAAEEAEALAPQAGLAAPVQVAPEAVEAEQVVEEPRAPPAPREDAAAAVLAPETVEAAAVAPAQQGPEPRCDGSTDASAEVQEVTEAAAAAAAQRAPEPSEALSAEAAADAYDPYAVTEAAEAAAARQAWEPSETLPADAAADACAAAEAPTVGAAAPAPACVAATHAYDGTNACGEGFLELRAGDQIVCLSGEAQGWARGRLVQPAGRSQVAGWFPASYVTPAPAAARPETA